MSRIEEAIERLERAVARLEAANAAARAGPPIAERLAATEAENRRLREAASEIVARVDNALARVGEALGGDV